VLGHRAGADDAGEGRKKGGVRAGDTGEGGKRAWLARAEGRRVAGGGDMEDGGGCGDADEDITILDIPEIWSSTSYKSSPT
jgi:hypothetical protein